MLDLVGFPSTTCDQGRQRRERLIAVQLECFLGVSLRRIAILGEVANRTVAKEAPNLVYSRVEEAFPDKQRLDILRR